MWRRRWCARFAIIRTREASLLTALHDGGRLDILRVIRDGILRSSRSTTRISVGPPFAADRGIRTAACRRDARVGLRKTLGAKHPRSYNLDRSAALGFLHDTVKRSHGLYAAVRDVSPCRSWSGHRGLTWRRSGCVTSSRRQTPIRSTRSRRPWRPPACAPASSGDAGKSWPTGSASTAPSATPASATSRWRARRQRRGSTTGHSSELTSRAIEPYDLRRCFARWMESAGIPRVRRRMYMATRSATWRSFTSAVSSTRALPPTRRSCVVDWPAGARPRA